jgi:hypothetical protein
MKHNKYVWEEFESLWLKQFLEVVNAIKMINLYPERLHLANLGNLFHHDELLASQKEWVRLYNKFHTIEKDYYKPYHVPVNCDDYKTFIDLSKDGYPVFEPIYNAHTNKWFQMNRFESLQELIEFLDSDSYEPPVWDKEFAAQIETEVAELDMDDINQVFNRVAKGIKQIRALKIKKGFESPPILFPIAVALYMWANGIPWDRLIRLVLVDEGDMTSLIMRTADHLRQVASLKETHPDLAGMAENAIELILREPVYID